MYFLKSVRDFFGEDAMEIFEATRCWNGRKVKRWQIHLVKWLSLDMKNPVHFSIPDRRKFSRVHIFSGRDFFLADMPRVYGLSPKKSFFEQKFFKFFREIHLRLLLMVMKTDTSLMAHLSTLHRHILKAADALQFS